MCTQKVIFPYPGINRGPCWPATKGAFTKIQKPTFFRVGRAGGGMISVFVQDKHAPFVQDVAFTFQVKLLCLK